MAPQRAPLARGLEVRLARHPVLVVGQLVAERGHHLGEHDPGVGLEPVLPVGVAQGGEVEERPAQAPEVPGEIVDRRVHLVVGRAERRLGRAVEVARAGGLEAEDEAVEVRVDPRVVDRQHVEREAAREGERQPQRVAAVDHRPGDGVDRHYRCAVAAAPALDRDLAGGKVADQRHVEVARRAQEEDVERRLAGVDVDEVDAGDLGLRAQLLEPVGRHSVTSRFRNRRSPRARTT